MFKLLDTPQIQPICGADLGPPDSLATSNPIGWTYSKSLQIDQVNQIDCLPPTSELSPSSTRAFVSSSVVLDVNAHYVVPHRHEQWLNGVCGVLTVVSSASAKLRRRELRRSRLWKSTWPRLCHLSRPREGTSPQPWPLPTPFGPRNGCTFRMAGCRRKRTLPTTSRTTRHNSNDRGQCQESPLPGMCPCIVQ